MNTEQKARAAMRRRAFSLVELMAVIALLALIAAAAIGRFCTGTLENVAAEGYARRLAVDLHQARRRTIATGDNHYLSITVASGKVTTYTMYRRASGGDVVVDKARLTPSGVSVTTSSTTPEYDFDGATLAAYTIAATGPTRTWTITTTMATGAVTTTISP